MRRYNEAAMLAKVRNISRIEQALVTTISKEDKTTQSQKTRAKKRRGEDLRRKEGRNAKTQTKHR